MIIYEYTLLDLKYLTENIVLLNFAPTPTSPILTYASGQYINVLTDNGPFPLSIANAPIQHNDRAGNMITVHLRTGQQHPVAEAFLNQVKQQNCIKFKGPLGHCVAKPADYYYFIAGGTGLSPIQALLTELLPIGKPCILYWGVSETKDLYQQKLILDWQKKYPHFSYIPVFSGEDNLWRGKKGWVHDVFFEEQSKKLQHLLNINQTYTLYASGPYPMIQAIKDHFIRFSLPLDKLLSDMLPLKSR